MTYTIFTLFVSNPLGRTKWKFSLNSSTPNQENATVSIDRLWEAETNPSAFKNPIDMFYRKDFSFFINEKREEKWGYLGKENRAVLSPCCLLFAAFCKMINSCFLQYLPNESLNTEKDVCPATSFSIKYSILNTCISPKTLLHFAKILRYYYGILSRLNSRFSKSLRWCKRI